MNEKNHSFRGAWSDGYYHFNLVEMERYREVVDENLKLRRLLRQCQPFVARLQPPILGLAVEIAEELKRLEVGDE